MRMPVVFVGHGSPMNAVEDNVFSRGWRSLGERIPRPKAILAVSAHWQSKGTRVCDALKPKQIYDFYGFPSKLYEVVYEVEGSQKLAGRVVEILGDAVSVDNSWGVDHGSWSVLSRIYPEADIPVVQVSLDYGSSPEEHFEMGRKLAVLRDEGYLIFGSGNVVHNLGMIDWGNDGGFAWAVSFDAAVRDGIVGGGALGEVIERGVGGSLAVPTNEHYLPLLYCLGAAIGAGNDGDREYMVEVFNEGCVLGSISMTSYIFR